MKRAFGKRPILRRIPWMSLGVAASIVVVAAVFAAAIIERATYSGGGWRAAVRALVQVAGLAAALGVSLVWKLREAADRIEDEQEPPEPHDKANWAGLGGR